MVCIDAKSKWAKIKVFKDAASAQSAMAILEDIFVTHKYSCVMVSNSATIFTLVFKPYCKYRGIFQLINSSSYLNSSKFVPLQSHFFGIWVVIRWKIFQQTFSYKIRCWSFTITLNVSLINLCPRKNNYHCYHNTSIHFPLLCPYIYDIVKGVSCQSNTRSNTLWTFIRRIAICITNTVYFFTRWFETFCCWWVVAIWFMVPTFSSFFILNAVKVIWLKFLEPLRYLICGRF